MIFSILGSQKELSIQEIAHVTGVSPAFSSSEVAIFDNFDISLQNLQSILGGTQKLGYIIGSVKPKELDSLIFLCSSILTEIDGDKKITFGFSVYEVGNEISNKMYADINILGLEIKKKLKEAGRSARLVTSKENTLSSVIITKNKILERGAEFVLFFKDDEILVGQTETVQNFEDWSHRDYDRPRRNAKQGMLPPKLTRMMINLSGVEPVGKVLLDPFCGSGTVLMEGAILGFEKVIGGDINEMAISDTDKNMGWLKNEGFDVPEVELHVSKAENISSVLEENSVDLIVTEPFLGHPRQGHEDERTVRAQILDLEILFKKSFESLVKLLKDDARVVIVSPVHVMRDKDLEPRTAEILESLGLTQIKFEKPLIYFRKGQFVKRNILMFKKA